MTSSLACVWSMPALGAGRGPGASPLHTARATRPDVQSDAPHCQCDFPASRQFTSAVYRVGQRYPHHTRSRPSSSSAILNPIAWKLTPSTLPISSGA